MLLCGPFVSLVAEFKVSLDQKLQLNFQFQM